MLSSGQRPSTAWTPSEDQILMNTRAQGLNWAPIQQAHFPNKTPNACRKRHERLMERRNAEDWDADKLESLAKEYLNLRKDMWSMLANQVGEKWQVVEAKCMEKGLKNIQSAGRSAQRRERLAAGMDEGSLGGDDRSDPGESRERSEEGLAATEQKPRPTLDPQRAKSFHCNP
ncbi:MAG: hypothetical protein M1837_004095 [Sclerophora amabilis]|nr:MAG: hypothetical protein M1837_004095 [Sclerophora amabilis]